MTETPTNDPTRRNSLYEAKWILLIWLGAFVWVVFFCGTFGYESRSDQWDVDRDLRIVFGMPFWAFWGVFFPWLVTAFVTAWFALFKMRDDRLDETEAEDE